MEIGGGFVLDSEWYWRIFEGDARFGDTPGKTAARDFLHPLASLARDHAVIDEIAIDPDGDGVQFRVAGIPVAIRCRDLRLRHFIEAINQSFADAKLDLAFTIGEARRYELRGILVQRSGLTDPRLARGTIPP